MKHFYLVGIVSVVAPVQLILSLFILLRGHNEPGGGFIGGLIASSSLILWYLFELVQSERIQKISVRLIFLGLFCSLMSAGTPLYSGQTFFKGLWGAGADIPFVGYTKISTVLFFDIGVYMLVAGFGTLFSILAKENLSP